ncbi:hypothetical protein [Idiomarina sp. OXR-189]|uniref:hypothetical protein n=1 Tax=Idiomarina sp. OXR-189 TaxID=3100175 RepID=UPI002AC99EBE|nr:hypothetical protein [Idiomarina sp. OXR-189]WPZ01158.1 hypothetical protein UM402_11885 [Idiomarina sp. OXR-189]|tara:strand:- start:185 stop:418 length:234 start_codon:yes stop_codon:yes gene_type:complete
MGFWDAIFDLGKKALSEGTKQTKDVSNRLSKLKRKSDSELLKMVTDKSWSSTVDSKDKAVARQILKSRGYTDEQLRK